MNVIAFRRISLTLVLLTGLAASPAGADLPTAFPYAHPGLNQLVSVSSTETQGDGNSFVADTSANGRYVAFLSAATDLVPGDTNGKNDIFVRDTVAGTTERVSLSSDEIQANGDSLKPSISANGRYVAFISYSTNLTNEEDTFPFNSEVYVRDLLEGTTERITHAHTGGPSTGSSVFVSISGDGRYVALHSSGSDLLPNDTNARPDVFVYDRQTDVMELVSVAPDGTLGNASSTSVGISDDGRFIAFRSAATNIVAGDENGEPDVFLRDLTTDTTEIISVATDGTQGNGDAFSLEISMSSDARFVAFQSSASNLVPNDTNGLTDPLAGSDVFVRDRELGTTERVSVDSAGGEFIDAFAGSLSDNGRFVAFHATRKGEDTSDFGAFADVYVHDRETASTERVSVTPRFADPANGDSENAEISADGRYVYFQTGSSDFVPGDGNEFFDIVRRVRGPIRGILTANAEPSGTGHEIGGVVRFSGDVLATNADPTGEPGTSEAGADLIGASATYRHEEADVLFRLKLASMPAIEAGSASVVGTSGNVGGNPHLVYGVSFELAGRRYEIRAQRASASEAAAPAFTRYVCGDQHCAGGGVTIPGGFGSTGPEIRMSLPAPLMGLQPGEKLESITAFVGPGEMATSALAHADEVTLADVTAPEPRVRLGRGPNDGQSVVYEVDAYPFAGKFSEVLDGSLAPDHSYWASVCLDQTCSAPQKVAVGSDDGDPDPEPTPTPTPDPTPTPEATTLELTDASAQRGQYTDRAALKALLKDADGAPIAGAKVSFTLEGSSTSRLYRSTTDGDGVARVDALLDAIPGHYDLTATYPGTSGTHEASEDATEFAITREDTHLFLSKARRRTRLNVRLVDEDERSRGVGGRRVALFADGMRIARVTTDSTGRASTWIPRRYRRGRHGFTVRFAGDRYFLSSLARARR